MEYSTDSEYRDMSVVGGNDAYKREENNQPVRLTQAKLNNIIRELTLSKEHIQLLGSCLKEKNMLPPGTTFSWYRDNEREFKR